MGYQSSRGKNSHLEIGQRKIKPLACSDRLSRRLQKRLLYRTDGFHRCRADAMRVGQEEILVPSSVIPSRRPTIVLSTTFRAAVCRRRFYTQDVNQAFYAIKNFTESATSIRRPSARSSPAVRRNKTEQQRTPRSRNTGIFSPNEIAALRYSGEAQVV